MNTPIIQNLDLVAQGKVRDIYAIDQDHILLVTSDRMSAFDVVLPDPIPNKGEVLTQLSLFWFEQTENIVANHLSNNFMLEDLIQNQSEIDYFKKRSMVVKRLHPLPIEAVVRGYLIGSGWKDYQANGSVCGIELADNLQMAAQVKDLALAIYSHGVQHARERGIIIADTKFEFGLDENGKLYLIDEVLTPDSSRFWAIEDYQLGISPPSFDKQYLRDYLETLDWDKTAPGPKLPQEIIENTAAKYKSAYKIITG